MRRLLTSVLLVSLLILPGGAAGHVPAARAASRQAAPQAPAARPRYTITDLGSLGGGFSQAFGINDKGHVVGLTSVGASAPEPVHHAFIWASGVMTDVGTLGGLQSSAADINDAGQVVGTSQTAVSQRAFLWQNGAMQDLGTFGGPGSAGTGINNAGKIVGGAEKVDSTNPDDPVEIERAFLWDGSLHDLGTLGGVSAIAYGINDAGDVVGGAELPGTGDPPFHAFHLQGGAMQDLGTLGGYVSVALAINNEGQIVGWSHLADWTKRAFLWQDGSMLPLGTLGGNHSIAHAINDAGLIVGESRTAENQGRAFLWVDGQMKDLNTLLPASLGWVLVSAEGINERGQIVGWGNHNGQTRAFLLTPIAYYWVNPSGGSWRTTANWDPQGIPGEGDTTIFDLSGDYAVDAAAPPAALQLSETRLVERMVISGTGTVNLNNLDFSLSSDTPSEPALEISHGGTAIVHSGAASFTHAVVGGQDPDDPANPPTARLQVFNDGTSLTGSGRLTIGDKGLGDLFVANGGHLVSAEARLGGTYVGTAVVGGEDSLWETGSIAVGFGVSGTLTIEEGGRVDSQTATVGHGSFSGVSQVVVDGAAAGGSLSSLWTVEANLTIGEGANSEVVVRKGAQLVVNQNVFVKQGALSVWEAAANGDGSRLSVQGHVVVGGNPDHGGVLTLNDGAEGEIGGNLVVGQGGIGVLIVSADPNSSEISKLLVESPQAGLCAFGRMFDAEIGISFDSIVVCRNVEIGQAGTTAAGTVYLSSSTLMALDVVRVGAVGSGPATVAMDSPSGGPGRLRGVNGVYNAPTGTISGTGQIVAGGIGLLNEGVIHPGIAIVSSVQATTASGPLANAASLAISGTLTLSDTAQLEIPIAGSAAGLYGSVAVTGTAALDGLLILAFQSYLPQKGDRFTFLTSTGGVTGAFNSVEVRGLPSGFDYHLSTQGGQVVLEALTGATPEHQVFLPHTSR